MTTKRAAIDQSAENLRRPIALFAQPKDDIGVALLVALRRPKPVFEYTILGRERSEKDQHHGHLED
jgi:hypothetical protein